MKKVVAEEALLFDLRLSRMQELEIGRSRSSWREEEVAVAEYEFELEKQEVGRYMVDREREHSVVKRKMKVDEKHEMQKERRQSCYKYKRSTQSKVSFYIAKKKIEVSHERCSLMKAGPPPPPLPATDILEDRPSNCFLLLSPSFEKWIVFEVLIPSMFGRPPFSS